MCLFKTMPTEWEWYLIFLIAAGASWWQKDHVFALLFLTCCPILISFLLGYHYFVPISTYITKAWSSALFRFLFIYDVNQISVYHSYQCMLLMKQPKLSVIDWQGYVVLWKCMGLKPLIIVTNSLNIYIVLFKCIWVLWDACWPN